MLSLERIVFGFRPDEALLQEITWSPPAGGISTIIGPNGAGKSTLLRIACGLLRPWSGVVALKGADLHQMHRRERARVIAYLPQRQEIPKGITVRQTVSLGRHPHEGAGGFESKRDRDVIEAALDSTDTSGLANRYVSSLSGGEAQRVYLAACLAQEPQVLLLDEPTAGLDVYHQLHFFETLRRLTKETNFTVVTVLHDLNLAMRYAREVLLLHDCKTAAQGPPAEALTAELLAQVYRVRFRRADGAPGVWIADGLDSAQAVKS